MNKETIAFSEQTPHLAVAMCSDVEVTNLSEARTEWSQGHRFTRMLGALMFCGASVLAAYGAHQTTEAPVDLPGLETTTLADISHATNPGTAKTSNNPAEVQPANPYLAICRDPGEWVSSDVQQDAAERCAAISSGRVELDVYADTKRPLGKILQRVKKLDRVYSAGERTLKVVTKRVTKSVNYYFGLRSTSQGQNPGNCIVLNVDPIAAATVMELGKDQGDLASVFTDKKACGADGSIGIAAGAADGQGGNDIYEVGNRQLSQRVLADVELHELGHGSGFGHMGTYLVKKLLMRNPAKRTIPQEYFVGNTFNLANYLSQSKTKVYDPTCEYVMGLSCDVGTPEIPPVQQATQAWWKRILGRPTNQNISEIDNGSFMLSTQKGSTDVGIINLGQSIAIPAADDEVNAPSSRFANQLSVDVVRNKGKKTVLRFYLGDKVQNNYYCIGNIDPSLFGGNVNIELPASQRITITAQGDTAAFSVTPADPQQLSMK